MNVAIIGAGGFIGGRLAAALADRGWCVHGLDVASAHAPDAPAVRRCDVTAGSITLPDDLDAVFYLAQSPHYRQGGEHLADLYAVNVVGAVRAATAARVAGAKLFVYASTGNVYAPSFQPRRESDPVRRDDPYALSKIAAEEALALLEARRSGGATDSMRVLRVRLFGVFGPGQRRMLLPNLIQRLRDGSPIDIEPRFDAPDDRDGLRVSLCFVDDVVDDLRQLVELATSEDQRARTMMLEVLNVGGPEAVSIRELAERLAAALGVRPRYQVANRVRHGDLVADIALLRQTIRPAFTPLDQAIARTTADLTGVSHVS